MQVLRTGTPNSTAIELLKNNGYTFIKSWTESNGDFHVTKLQKGTEVVLIRQLV
jgi:hypothetical protein